MDNEQEKPFSFKNFLKEHALIVGKDFVKFIEDFHFHRFVWVLLIIIFLSLFGCAQLKNTKTFQAGRETAPQVLDALDNKGAEKIYKIRDKYAPQKMERTMLERTGDFFRGLF